MATEDDRKGHLLPCGPRDPHTSVETTRAEGVQTVCPPPAEAQRYTCAETAHVHPESHTAVRSGTDVGTKEHKQNVSTEKQTSEAHTQTHTDTHPATCLPETLTLPREVETTWYPEQENLPTLTSLLPARGSRQLALQSQEGHQEEEAPGPHVSAAALNKVRAQGP